MRIGIVTFQSAPNYGAALQAYALQTYLEKIGHSPFFIRWNRYESTPADEPRGSFTWIPRKPVHKVYMKLLRRKFRSFSDRYLKNTPLFYPTFNELSANPPAADAYICGSDQIWNPRFVSPRRQPIAWLRFGHEDARRVAYAASFGRPDLDDDLRQRWTSYASDLNAVSVREEEGIELMRILGRQDAEWVPDPTLLLSPDDYVALASGAIHSGEDYLFSYMIHAGSDNSDVYAKCKGRIRGLRRLALRECEPRWAPMRALLTRNMPSPNEWLGRLHNAAFVMTNSFHGLMFSLLFRRPFVVVLRTGAGIVLNGRLQSILRVAGLEHRAVVQYARDQVACLCQEEIDWDPVNRRLATFRETGQRFLRSALS